MAERHIHASKKYCTNCYTKIKKESEDYKELIDFICENFMLECPTGLILKQIKDYKEKFSYTYAGITYTLWYAKAILQKNFIMKYGIAIVKYHYEDACNFYLQQEKRMRSSENKIQSDIKIRRVKRLSEDQPIKNPLINIENLIKGGDIH